MGVVVMEPIKGGRLAGRVPAEVQAIWDQAGVRHTPAEWALRFVWDDSDVSLLLSGMSTMEQVEENVRVAEQGIPGSLTDAELELIERVRKVYQERVVVECTGCRYCMPCPSGIDIPTIFSTINDASLYGDAMGEKFLHNINVELGVTARISECAECGQCEAVCPQSIEVPKAMADAGSWLED